jgi:hypothetical protein
MIDGWWSLFRDSPTSVRDVIHAAEGSADLRSALRTIAPGPLGGVSPSRLGRLLSAREGTSFFAPSAGCSVAIVRYANHGNRMIWSLVPEEVLEEAA